MNREYCEKIQSSEQALNLKSKEVILKQDALEEKQGRIERLNIQINEQTLSLNHLQDLNKSQE